MSILILIRSGLRAWERISLSTRVATERMLFPGSDLCAVSRDEVKNTATQPRGIEEFHRGIAVFCNNADVVLVADRLCVCRQLITSSQN
jgi:hypothetical protein